MMRKLYDGERRRDGVRNRVWKADVLTSEYRERRKAELRGRAEFNRISDDLLKHEVPEVRALGVKSLVELYTMNSHNSENRPLNEKIAEKAIEIAENDPDWKVRCKAIEALPELYGSREIRQRQISTIIGGLREEGYVFESACKALLNVSGDLTLPHLSDARFHAMQALLGSIAMSKLTGHGHSFANLAKEALSKIQKDELGQTIYEARNSISSLIDLLDAKDAQYRIPAKDSEDLFKIMEKLKDLISNLDRQHSGIFKLEEM